MTAVIALSRCSKTKKMYGIRLESVEKDWKYTWAFPIQEKTALNEDYDKTNIKGSFIEGEEYPGCPHCGSKGFFMCGCGKLNCWNGESRLVKCSWCGSSVELRGVIESLNISGNL